MTSNEETLICMLQRERQKRRDIEEDLRDAETAVFWLSVTLIVVMFFAFYMG